MIVILPLNFKMNFLNRNNYKNKNKRSTTTLQYNYINGYGFGLYKGFWSFRPFNLKLQIPKKNFKYNNNYLVLGKSKLVKPQSGLLKIYQDLPTLSQVFSTTSKVIHNVVDSFGKIVSANFVDVINNSANKVVDNVLFGARIVRAVVSILDFLDDLCGIGLTKNVITKGKTTTSFFTRLSIVLLNMYELYETILESVGIDKKVVENYAEAHSQSSPFMFETLFAGGFLSMVLPNMLKKILKDLPLFTSFKLLDDTMWIYQLMNFVFSVPRRLLSMIDNPLAKQMVSFLWNLENNLPFSSMIFFKQNIYKIVEEVQRNNKLLGDKSYQEKFLKFYKDYEHFVLLYKNVKKDLPGHMLDCDKKITNIKNLILYGSTTTRREPLFVLFLGPPGTGKTTFMNKVVSGYAKKNTVYTHVASTEPGKDFFDMYRNEEIVVFDDIGQQGVAQWSSIINMISTTKFPLNAAIAENKFTRMFTSNLVFGTTNSINLTLTGDCGISDIQALHRRMTVVDFSRVEFHNGVWTGTAIVRTYTPHVNPNMGKWTNIASFDFKKLTIKEVLVKFDKFVRERLARLIEFKKQIDCEVEYEVLPQAGMIEWIHDDVGVDFEKQFFEDYGCSIEEYEEKQKEEMLKINRKIMSELSECEYDLVLYDLNKSVNDLGVEPRCHEELYEFSPKCFEVDSNETIPGTMFNRMKSYFVEWVDNYKKYYDNVHQLCGKYLNIGIGIAVAGLSAGIVLMMKTLYTHIKKFVNNKKNDKIRKSVIKHYKSGRVVKTYATLPQSVENILSLPINKQATENTCLTRIENQTRAAEFCLLTDGCLRKFSSTVVCAGAYMVTTLHNFLSKLNSIDKEQKISVTLWENKDTIIYDKITCSVYYFDQEEDIIILKLPVFAPRFMKNINFSKNTTNNKIYLITPSGVADVGQIEKLSINMHYKSYSGFIHKLSKDEALTYDLEGDGLCGSMLVTKDGFLLGMHVAVNYDDSGAHGISRIFKERTVSIIQKCFEENVDFMIDRAKQQKISGSIVEIDKKVYQHVSDKTKYVPSLVYGITPVEREPARLNSRLTLPLARKNFLEVSEVNPTSLDFAGEVARTLLSVGNSKNKHKPWNDFEIVTGDENIGEIDKDTSVGYGYKGLTKHDFIDFENKKLTEFCLSEMEEVKKQILKKEFTTKMMFSMIQKDELRNLNKIALPRVFCMGPIIHTLLLRKYLGPLMSKVSKYKFLNGFMCGINPLSEQWKNLLEVTVKFGDNVIDGDYASWDAKMLPQFQQKAHEILVEFLDLSEDDKLICNFLLCMLIFTPTVIENKCVVTTHGMPSGCGVTTFVNSLINKMYLAYSFHKLYNKEYNKNEFKMINPGIDLYLSNVVDNVYGDDKLVGLSDKVKDWFNGITIEGVMNEIGVGFTPADKGEWTYKYRSIYDCSFLKRGFLFNHKLKTIVAPLEKRSMLSTLNFVSDDFRNLELTLIKLQNFQREAFLHNDYDLLMDNVLNELEQKKFSSFVPLTEKYLQKIYHDPEFDYGGLLSLQ